MILPAHAGAALAEDSAYTDEVTFGMGVDASGDALLLATWIDKAVDRYTSRGRRSDDFADSAAELLAAAASQRICR